MHLTNACRKKNVNKIQNHRHPTFSVLDQGFSTFFTSEKPLAKSLISQGNP